MPHYTPHQKKIIERYYEHRDQILLARLQEIITELYLADTDGARKRLWNRAAKALDGLKVPPDLKAGLLQRKAPEELAGHLREWLKQAPAEGK